MSDPIKQELVFLADASKIYQALTMAAEFSKMSGGAPAEIDAVAGGAFSCFGGMIHGINIELISGERVVQAWRAKNWDAGVYSIVRFEISSTGGETRVVLHHAAFPEDQGEHLDAGWHANYWEPMKKYLAG